MVDLNPDVDASCQTITPVNMADSIAATSLIGYRPLSGGLSVKDGSYRRKSLSSYWRPLNEFVGKKILYTSPMLPRLKIDKLANTSIKALATELTKEAYSFREEERVPRTWNYRVDTGVARKPGLWPPENRADNPSLHNPLIRQERMGCGWLGAIFEWEGVIIEDNPDLERQAWLSLSREEGKPAPPAFILRRVEGMKNEQVISEVLCWSRDPADNPKPSSGDDSSAPKRNRGRPPGSGRKQQLATLGEWMNSSAGVAFSPHVISIGVGEDIVSKLLSFSQQRPRAICILSGTGTVSSVTLRQPASSESSITYEVQGSKIQTKEQAFVTFWLLVAEDGGPHNRTGGISASLSSPDGHVIGGALAMLIAASPVQVVVCSFVYGVSKDKQASHPQNERDATSWPDDNLDNLKSITPVSMPQGFTPSPTSSWPGPQPVHMRNPHTDIDLTRG